MIPPLSAIGQVVKTHGVDGELCIAFDVDNIDSLLEATSCVMIYDEGLPVPFFIASTRSRGLQSRLILLDGICSKEKASGLVGKEVFLPSDIVANFCSNDADGLYASDLIGFTMLNDDNGSEIGEIVDINEATENALFVVLTSDGEILIPITDDFITDIDTVGKTITLSLPSGLIEALTK